LEVGETIRQMEGSRKDENIENNSGGSTGIKREKQDRFFFFIFLIISIVCLALSIHIASQSRNFFASLRTFQKSPYFLSSGFPNAKPIAIPFIKEILGRLLQSYFLPVALVVLAVASLLACLHFSKVNPEKLRFENITGFVCKKYTGVALLLIFFAGVVMLRLWVMGRQFFSIDEFAYVFQSAVLRKLSFFAEAPSPADSFSCWGIVINQGKWFSRYTIGFPLLLVIPTFLKIPYLLNPLIGVFCVFFTYKLGEELFNKNTGILAAFILALSPFFVFNNLPIYPHPAFLLFMMVFVLYYLRSLKSPGLLNPILAGAAAGLALNVRPGDFAFPGILFAAASIAILAAGKYGGYGDRKKFVEKFGTMLGISLIFLCLTFFVNWRQTSDPFQFAFQLERAGEKWGFNYMNHTPLKGLLNTVFNSANLLVWCLPLTVEAALVSLFERRRENLFLFLLFLCPIAFYFFYYGIGVLEFGPRFYHFALLSLPILSSRGIMYIRDKARIVRCYRLPLVSCFLLIVVIMTLISSYPLFARQGRLFTNSVNQFFDQWDIQKSNFERPNLIFIRTAPGNWTSFYTRNMPSLNSPSIRVNWLDPETNDEVISGFKERLSIVADYDQQNHRWTFSPYRPFSEKTKPEKIRDLSAAAINYQVSAENSKKAIEAINYALELDPDREAEMTLLPMKASLLTESGRYRLAEEVWKKILQKFPNFNEAYLDLGLLYYKMEKREESLAMLREYILRVPGGKNSIRARIWEEYVQER